MLYKIQIVKKLKLYNLLNGGHILMIFFLDSIKWISYCIYEKSY